METINETNIGKSEDLERDLKSSDENSDTPKSTQESDSDDFFFESDHLALRGNKDYQKLLRSYMLLSAQKDEMLKNYDTLNAVLTLSQEKPLEFVNLLKSGEIKLPERITPVNVPKIDLQQYENKVPEYLLSKAKNTYNEDKMDERVDPYLSENHCSRSDKLWTVAEQRKLEDLLVQFPPEEVEMRRFAKIAKALGNRTTKQVASRIQKYFIKLHKAGLPVPGRLPKIRQGKRSLKNPVFHNSYSLIKPSTFFPTLNIPSGLQNIHNQDVRNITHQEINETSETADYNDDEVSESDSKSDDSSSECETTTLNKYAFRLIKRVYKDKQKDDLRPYSIHMRHRCNFCDETPIVGTRWHCMDCTNRSIDFCSDCLVAQTEDSDNITHPLSHNLVPFRSKHECKPKDIKLSDIKKEAITKANSIAFTPETETKYIEHLTKKCGNKQITSQTYLSEILSLNLGNSNITIQENYDIKVKNVSDFFKDKTVMNIVTNSDVSENIFADCDESVNVKLLNDFDKEAFNSKLILLANKNCIAELLDHDYNAVEEFKEIKLEHFECDDNNDNTVFINNISPIIECNNVNFQSSRQYEDKPNDVLHQTSHKTLQLISEDDLFNVGREEFIDREDVNSYINYN